MSTRVPFKIANELTASSDGNDSRGLNANKLLRALPRRDLKTLLSRMEPVELPVHRILNEVGKPIEYGYFITGGLASILTVLAGGKSVEVGLTGTEGFVGVPLIAGFKSSPTRVIIQIEGAGFKISAKDLVKSLRDCPTLDKSLQQHSQAMALQSTQVAACNRLHDVNQRLARWLLMSQDRVGGSVVKLTQEFLSHMLGTRRASVTVAAGVLQKAGLITYTRGAVKIENRQGLEAASCECYAAINRQTNLWESESKS